MKKIKIRHLPPVSIANLLALMRLLSLALVALIDAVYFPAMFGPRSELPGDVKTSVALLVYKWLMSVIMAWLSGFLVCTLFNALAARRKAGLTVETEE